MWDTFCNAIGDLEQQSQPMNSFKKAQLMDVSLMFRLPPKDYLAAIAKVSQRLFIGPIENLW